MLVTKQQSTKEMASLIDNLIVDVKNVTELTEQLKNLCQLNAQKKTSKKKTSNKKTSNKKTSNKNTTKPETVRVYLTGGAEGKHFGNYKNKNQVQTTLDQQFPGKIIWTASNCDYLVFTDAVQNASPSSIKKAGKNAQILSWTKFQKVTDGWK